MAKQTKRTRQQTSGRPLEQVAALPFRMSEDGVCEVLVMTSRETRRAVIPKGWPMKNRKSWTAAKIEARQEAGVIGDIRRKPIGHYRYWKRFEGYFALVKVAVYPMAVHRQLAEWPERHERMQLWLPAEDAAVMVDEPDLGALILSFSQSTEAAKMGRPAGKSVGRRRASGLSINA